MRSADGSGATVGGSGVPDRRGPLRYGVGELGSSGSEEDELLYLRDRMRRPRFRNLAEHESAERKARDRD